MFRLSLVIAAAALLTAAGPAAAQQPHIPPGARGFQVAMMWQDFYQHRATTATPAPVPRTARPAPTVGPLQVAVSVPTGEPKPVYVDIRGPDGSIRRFPLEGGRQAIHPREVIVHAGESVTVTLTASAQAK
jgi:hypothetical protein